MVIDNENMMFIPQMLIHSIVRNSRRFVSVKRYTHTNTKFDAIIDWAQKCPNGVGGNTMTNVEERTWGNNMIGQTGNVQWTTKLGENLVFTLLERLGQNPRRPVSRGGYKPDWETDDLIYEVKTRNWNTRGTAGEKVYGCPFKYAQIPLLYNKPLLIVCVAYQEYELTYGNTPVFGDNLGPVHEGFIEFYKSNDIEYLKCTELISKYKEI